MLVGIFIKSYYKNNSIHVAGKFSRYVETFQTIQICVYN